MAAKSVTACGTDPSAMERPHISNADNAAAFGSDVIAETLAALDLPFIPINPGASYRGLHDSIVNFLGNKQPQMILCLQEEAAVAIAHGYAKITGKAMAVAVHSNVGLLHAAMAIFNAWCDRVPMLILGATGPVDAMKRRPWIDWIHTSADQGALVRGFTKWDDQPASPGAARESVLRAFWLSNTRPCGPTYVNLDADMQEQELAAPLPLCRHDGICPKWYRAHQRTWLLKRRLSYQGRRSRCFSQAGSRVGRTTGVVVSSWQRR